ncbi:MAG: hypothetical protein COB14_07730 [Alphaproteobacteria bacterium]|nr:MAG: hypothetical protein COB14_07730 [Alphaproteobacteria bacterium]
MTSAAYQSGTLPWDNATYDDAPADSVDNGDRNNLHLRPFLPSSKPEQRRGILNLQHKNRSIHFMFEMTLEGKEIPKAKRRKILRTNYIKLRRMKLPCERTEILGGGGRNQGCLSLLVNSASLKTYQVMQ